MNRLDKIDYFQVLRNDEVILTGNYVVVSSYQEIGGRSDVSIIFDGYHVIDAFPEGMLSFVVTYKRTDPVEVLCHGQYVKMCGVGFAESVSRELKLNGVLFDRLCFKITGEITFK
jgi:hypothetical protein